MSKNLIVGLLGLGLIVAGGPAFAAKRGDDNHDRTVVTVRVQDGGYDRFKDNDSDESRRYAAEKSRGDRYQHDRREFRGDSGRAVSRKVIKTRYRA